MRTLTKTIEKADYEALSSQIYLLRQAATELSAANCFIDGIHDARLWEYGLCLKALMDWLIKRPSHRLLHLKLVDVGAGDGLLGPALSMKANYGIEEIEPRLSCGTNRERCNIFLSSRRSPLIHWTHGDLTNAAFKSRKWDVVFCVSVVEHIQSQMEIWQSLADAVADGGLLFVTTDVVPVANRKYVFDNLRAVNYTPDVLRTICASLLAQGFKWFGGDPDWEYHGNEVHDYSFMSMCFTKGAM